MIIHFVYFFIFSVHLFFFRLVICHLWYRFSIDIEVLHSGIVPKPKLWYRAIPSLDKLTLVPERQSQSTGLSLRVS